MQTPRAHFSRVAHRAFAALLATPMTLHRAPAPTAAPSTPADRGARPARDRGDVPGWVMITMMTAIVVIVLLGVFQDAVVTAVRNAFDSITGQASGVNPGAGGTP